MLSLMAQKNLFLHEKSEILSKRTIRERWLGFFEPYRQGKKEGVLPYSREELAAYLCVDRSALFAELSRMQKEGMLRYHRNCFRLP